MTRTELRNILDQPYRPDSRLNYCQAWVSEETQIMIDGQIRNCFVLTSYRTKVALAYYDPEKGCVRVFTDNWYSATTVQHVHKFASHICKLYGLLPYNYEMNKMYVHSQMRKAQIREAEATDFAC